MLKKLLKRLFPIAFLKRLFLAYNIVKINTLDRMVYSKVILKQDEFNVYKTQCPFQDNNIDLSDLINRPEYEYMSAWRDWTQEQYLLKFKRKCTIEPVHGWGIVGINKLLYQSLSFSRTNHQKKPGLLRYWIPKKVVCAKRAISLRDTGEENYFHFYNDVVSKLFYLEQHGIDTSTYSIVIARKLWDKPYFQFYLKHVRFLQIQQWLIQTDEYVSLEEAVFCKPTTHTISYFDSFLKGLNAKKTAGNRKIFLTRSANRLRFIENKDNINSVCLEFGLEVIDSDELPISHQIDLFTACDVVVGIHGAGLTNILFMSGKCKILEIFPPPESGYLPYHYILLAKMKGFDYSAIIGSIADKPFSGSFKLDEGVFRRELSRLLW
jgi:hypothetical protein